MIAIKRIYDDSRPDDGHRVLVDRLWPRGVKKEDAELDEWAKEIAPSDELRRWFRHQAGKWAEFKEHYFKELAEKDQAVAKLMEKAEHGILTLLYAAKDTEYNNAAALKQYLERKEE